MSQLIHFQLPFDVVCDVCCAGIAYNQKFKARKEITDQGVVVRLKCPACGVELMFLRVSDRCYDVFRGCSKVLRSTVGAAASAAALEVQRESNTHEEVCSVSDLDFSYLRRYMSQEKHG